MKKVEGKDHLENGSSLMEILVALAFIAVVTLAFASSSKTSYKSFQHSSYNRSASRLASQTMEDLTSQSPGTLSDLDDLTENSVVDGTKTFSRTVDVTVNSDSTRTLSVTVTSNHSLYPVSVSLQSTVAPWGES